jgi:hypothetical protein
VKKNTELRRCQGQTHVCIARFVAIRHQSGIQLNRELSHNHRAPVTDTMRAPEHSADTLDDLAWVEWFDDIVIRAEAK